MSDPIWCGIPVYNNAATIFAIAQQCRELIPHVVVIDDGSTDADLTELLKPLDIFVIRHPMNRGKGQALLTGFRFAAERGGKFMITLDGDGQHFPQDISLFTPVLSPQAIVIGYRQHITGEMPQRSQFGRDFSDFWICVEAGGNARDTQSGFRAYPLEAILKLDLHSHFYNFEMEIVTKSLWAGMHIESVPIHVWYPPAQQRVSSFDPLRDNLRISLLHTRLVLRQLLQLPHPRLFPRPSFNAPRVLRGLLLENSTPLGLAVSAGLSLVMGIVLWPWGILAAGYVAIRWHLNKVVVVACVGLCSFSFVPGICKRVGSLLVSPRHLNFQWIVGSHLIAIPLALIIGYAVYKSANLSLKSRL